MLTGSATNAGSIEALNLFNLSAVNLTNSGSITAFEISKESGSSLVAGLSLNGSLDANGIVSFHNEGLIQAPVIRIDAQTLVNGITDPNRVTAPSRLPDPVIDLGSYFNTPGGSAPVIIDGVKYINGSPIPGASGERGPGWILEQVGDIRTGLVFYADPTTEQRAITQAILEQTGKTTLDPMYRNPQEQQEALWQATVDFLKSNPDIKLGNTLTAEQRAKITEPILWYVTQNINGEDVLVPQLILPEGRLEEWRKSNGGVMAADDLYLSGGSIHNTGALLAENTLSITADTFTNERRVANTGYAGGYMQHGIQDGGFIAGDIVQIKTTGDLINIGGSIVADSAMNLVAGGDLILTASVVENEYHDGSKKHSVDYYARTNYGGTVYSGGNLTVAAAGDVNIHASDLIAGKDMLVAAGAGENGRADASVTITAGQDFESHGRSQSKSGLFGGGGGWADIWHKKTLTTVDTDITNVGSSLTAGGDLTITAKSDINIQGSSVSAGGTAALDAGHDINITPGYDGTSDYYKKTEKGIGIRFSAGHGSAQVQDGYHSEKTTLTLDTASVVPSFIQGGAGVVMNAGNDINLQAAVVTSPGDITLSAGHDINATVAYDTIASTAKHEQLFVGVTAKVSQNVTGIISSLQQSAKIFNSGHGGAAYEAIGMASGVLKARDAIATASGGLRVSGSVMFGAEGSKTSTHEEMAIARGTILNAGGNLTLNAGNDVHLIGTQAHAGNDLSITAGRDVIIESAQSYSSSGSKSESWNAGIGIGGSLGANGATVGIQIEGGYANSKNDSWGIQQQNSYITAGNSVTIKSGNDTTIAGAIIHAPEVTLDVGHDLTIQSRQDTAHSDGSAVRGGGSLTIGIGSPSSVSGYVGGGQSESDVAWVTQQTGIYADGKLDITVGNHTQIDGAVINSNTGDLTLDTGTLGFSTIKDHDKGSAFDVTVSGSYSTSEDKRDPQTGGKNNVSVGGMIEDHDREQDTNATVGSGTIIIRDQENQKQDVADLNRDLDKAQVITKDESHGTQFYGSSDSINSAMNGFTDVPKQLEDAFVNSFGALVD